MILEVADLGSSAAFYRELVGLELHAGEDNELPGDRWLDGRHYACSWHEGAFMHFALYEARVPRPRACSSGSWCRTLKRGMRRR